MNLDINPQFSKALDLLKTGEEHLFITGKAGTGKSTLLNHFCKTTKDKPVILAPTGVAALNVQGQTIHNFFNFYIDVTPDKIINKQIRPKNHKIYQKINTIVIDEASMLRADLLDCIDVFLRIYGKNETLPFGGVQMVFIGDLYQLPPVVNKAEKKTFASLYDSSYFFSAKAIQNIELNIIELDKIYRQKDQDFIDLLNKIRNKTIEQIDLDKLNSQLYNNTNTCDKFTINLTSTNKSADQINEAKLGQLKHKSRFSHAIITGDFGKEYFPTSPELQYKIGAQIMMLNNDSNNRWVNGSIAEIIDVQYDEDEQEYLKVLLNDSNRVVKVYPHTWAVYRFFLKNSKLVSESIGSFTQYPFRLAWAITIHKSQGKTFDRAIIDLGATSFASGQTYVALSRCTSFEGITLKVPIKKHHVRVDYKIYKFLTDYAYKKANEKQSFDRKLEIIEEAIQSENELSIIYLKANDTRSERVIIPISVGRRIYQGKKFYGLLAYCTSQQEERMFTVDRILEIT
ncbi:putative helicase [Francisella sp. W12-1067]|nr:putative helicase [Francisella sp. W12-1067]